MPFLRSATWLLLVTCAPNACFAGYGLDVVPGSSFQQGTWHFYGTDQVPTTASHAAGLLTAYGSDQVPGALRDAPQRHPHHVLIAETIQHLTGAVEITPEHAGQPSPSKAPLRRDTRCPTGR